MTLNTYNFIKRLLHSSFLPSFKGCFIHRTVVAFNSDEFNLYYLCQLVDVDACSFHTRNLIQTNLIIFQNFITTINAHDKKKKHNIWSCAKKNVYYHDVCISFDGTVRRLLKPKTHFRRICSIVTDKISLTHLILWTNLIRFVRRITVALNRLN